MLQFSGGRETYLWRGKNFRGRGEKLATDSVLSSGKNEGVSPPPPIGQRVRNLLAERFALLGSAAPPQTPMLKR